MIVTQAYNSYEFAFVHTRTRTHAHTHTRTHVHTHTHARAICQADRCAQTLVTAPALDRGTVHRFHTGFTPVSKGGSSLRVCLRAMAGLGVRGAKNA